MNRFVSMTILVGLLAGAAHVRAQDKSADVRPQLVATAEKAAFEALAKEPQVVVSYYLDKDGFYHLYFFNEYDIAVRVKATFNGNNYNHDLGPRGSRDFTVGKQQPDLALLEWSVSPK
jgi:hypothetical protein